MLQAISYCKNTYIFKYRKIDLIFLNLRFLPHIIWKIVFFLMINLMLNNIKKEESFILKKKAIIAVSKHLVKVIYLFKV